MHVMMGAPKTTASLHFFSGLIKQVEVLQGLLFSPSAVSGTANNCHFDLETFRGYSYL